MTYSEAVLEREKFTGLIGNPITIKGYQNVIVEEVLIIPLTLDSMERIDLFWAVYKEKVPNKEYIDSLIKAENESKELKTGEEKYADVEVYIVYKTGDRYSDVIFLDSNYYIIGGSA